MDSSTRRKQLRVVPNRHASSLLRSATPLTLQLPDREFHAYLFDCDGTIADSMPLHYVAWRKALRAWGCEFPQELFYAWGGLSVTAIVDLLNQKHGLRMPVEDVLQKKEQCYFESLPDLKAVPEVLEHIHSGYGRIPLAVVSGSKRDSVTASLRALGLLEKFETLVCAGDYTRGKPDPEPFLLAASKLRVNPESCLVFEDTDLGIHSAESAGMATVRVPPPWQRHQRTSTPGDVRTSISRVKRT
jgi:beta-phosphoglucomutase-like phosphatase (HAD superfamily)